MAYDLATLTALRDNYVAQKAAASANFKPSYSVDGQSVSWVEYLKYLDGEITRLTAIIDAYDGGVVESFEF